ncbi:hypothetical protein Agub_g2520, partial [Astrephomene gubernaculifera]
RFLPRPISGNTQELIPSNVPEDHLKEPDKSSHSDEQEPLVYGDALSQAYINHHHLALGVRQRLLAAQRREVESAVRSAVDTPPPCPRCSTAGSPAGCQRCPVTIVMWDQAISVEVPLFWCQDCSSNYSIQPTVVDCLPDNRTFWDVSRRIGDNAVLWWHRTVLQQYHQLTCLLRRVSADGFCAAMLSNWEKNGVPCPSSVPVSSLRKRMHLAQLAYAHLQSL